MGSPYLGSPCEPTAIKMKSITSRFVSSHDTTRVSPSRGSTFSRRHLLKTAEAIVLGADFVHRISKDVASMPDVSVCISHSVSP